MEDKLLIRRFKRGSREALRRIGSACQKKNAEFEGVMMRGRHKELTIFGVQFHPESILTPAGAKTLENASLIAAKIKAGAMQ